MTSTVKGDFSDHKSLKWMLLYIHMHDFSGLSFVVFLFRTKHMLNSCKLVIFWKVKRRLYHSNVQATTLFLYRWCEAMWVLFPWNELSSTGKFGIKINHKYKSPRRLVQHNLTISTVYIFWNHYFFKISLASDAEIMF